MTQKGDPYAKLFSTLFGVILMSCVLSQLNILCKDLIKPYFTKNDDSPIIHRSHVTTILRILQGIGFDQSGVIHIKTFSTLSGVRTVFLILLQLDILCKSAAKRYCD